MNKPFSQSCENNKHPILSIIASVFSASKQVLEIGSGTGQHAVFFAKHLPNLTWQTGDLSENHPGINAWLIESSIENVKSPILIDLNEPLIEVPQIKQFDAIFSANTLHIVSWPLVINFFEKLLSETSSNTKVCIYGPFNYRGQYTSESNKNFDAWLKDRNPESGIRDIEEILKLAHAIGLKLIDDHAMPANNRLLVFSKT